MRLSYFFLFVVWFLVFLLLVRLKWITYKRMCELEVRYQKTFKHRPDQICLDKLILLREDEADSFFEEYSKLIRQSQIQSKKEKILFIGLIRNKGENVISFWPPIIDQIGSSFQDYQGVFVENDSDDGTRDVLLSFCKENPKYSVFCPKDKKWNSESCKMGVVSIQSKLDKLFKVEHRINVLTKLREVMLDEIKKMNDFDYVVILDWDLQGDFSKEGLFHALYLMRKQKEIDAVVSNSFYKHYGMYFVYDTFPLFTKDPSCEKDAKPNHWNKAGHKLQKIQTLKKYNDEFLNATHPVSIDSGFGGISIYRMSSLLLKDPHYDVSGRCPYLCEHVQLNQKLEIVLDPWFTFLIRKNLH